jgi:hypothetical protein
MTPDEKAIDERISNAVSHSPTQRFRNPWQLHINKGNVADSTSMDVPTQSTCATVSNDSEFLPIRQSKEHPDMALHLLKCTDVDKR